VLVSPTGDPSRGYLGSDSHAMGLLVGVALGVLAGVGAPWEAFSAWVRSNATARRGAPLLAAASLVAILVTMRATRDRTLALYRGGFLVFAVLCAVVIAVVVTMPDAPIARLLRTPWLVSIGLRSYSLYLWHWPVRVFVTPSSGLDGFGLFAVRLAISLVLAEASFRLVERPFRVGKVARRSGSRPAIAYFTALTLVAAVLVTTVAAPKPLPPTSLAQLKDPGVKIAPTTLRVDLFGDSTGLVFGLGGAFNGRALDLTVGGDAELGCSIVGTDHVTDGRVIKNPAYCVGWQTRWQASMRKDPTARLAIMAGAWEALDQKVGTGVVRFGTSAWTDLITSTLRLALGVLTADGRTVYLFDVPCYGTGDANDPIPERSDPRRIAALNEIFVNVARSTPKVRIVDWRTLVCPGGHRAENVGGVHLWLADDQHLSYPGAVVVWKWWLPQLRAAP
jgi:hypothetical protein